MLLFSGKKSKENIYRIMSLDSLGNEWDVIWKLLRLVPFSKELNPEVQEYSSKIYFFKLISTCIQFWISYARDDLKGGDFSNWSISGILHIQFKNQFHRIFFRFLQLLVVNFFGFY